MRASAAVPVASALESVIVPERLTAPLAEIAHVTSVNDASVVEPPLVRICNASIP